MSFVTEEATTSGAQFTGKDTKNTTKDLNSAFSFKRPVLTSEKTTRESIIHLDENNTTSKLNTARLEDKALKNKKRRVSFAPDVTLHTIDLTSDLKNINSKTQKKQLESNESEEQDDSEMEFTNPINHDLEMADILSNKDSHQDELLKSDEERDEKFNTEFGSVFGSQHLDQEINKNNSITDNNDTGMDLTSLNGNNSDEDEDMNFTSIQVDLKNIQDYPEDNELSDDDNEKSNVSMEITHIENQIKPFQTSGTVNKISPASKNDFTFEERLSPIPVRTHSNFEVAELNTVAKLPETQELALTEDIAVIPDEENVLLRFIKQTELDLFFSIATIDSTKSDKSLADFNFSIFKTLDEVPSVEISKETYTNKPVLPVLKFICSETSEKIANSKARILLMVKNMSESPNNIPPLILKFLSESTPMAEKTQLSIVFNALTNNSVLEAKNLWLSWRAQLLAGMSEVLQGNLDKLSSELSEQTDFLEKITKFYSRCSDIQDASLRKVEMLKYLATNGGSSENKTPSAAITFEQRVKWNEKRYNLLHKYNVDIGEISDYEKRKSEIIKKLKIAKNNLKNNSSNSDSALKALKEYFIEFDELIEFTKSATSIIATVNSPKIKIVFKNDSDDMSQVKTALESDDAFTNLWFQKVLINIGNLTFANKFEYISYILEERKKYILLLNSYNRLCLFYSTKIILEKSVSYIKFDVCDKWKKKTFKLTYSQFYQAVVYDKHVLSKSEIVPYVLGKNAQIQPLAIPGDILNVLPWLANLS